jgi:hypothetical protein
MDSNNETARFSHAEAPYKKGSNLGEYGSQQTGPETAPPAPSLQRTSTLLCCTCGFRSNHGVVISISHIDGYAKGFACERCFENPNMFFNGKRILPHWTLAIKSQFRVNNFARGYAKSSEGSANESLFLTKKSRMQVAMSESLYRGQKLLLEASP